MVKELQHDNMINQDSEITKKFKSIQERIRNIQEKNLNTRESKLIVMILTLYIGLAGFLSLFNILN